VSERFHERALCLCHYVCTVVILQFYRVRAKAKGPFHQTSRKCKIDFLSRKAAEKGLPPLELPSFLPNSLPPPPFFLLAANGCHKLAEADLPRSRALLPISPRTYIFHRRSQKGRPTGRAAGARQAERGQVPRLGRPPLYPSSRRLFRGGEEDGLSERRGGTGGRRPREGGRGGDTLFFRRGRWRGRSNTSFLDDPAFPFSHLSPSPQIVLEEFRLGRYASSRNRGCPDGHLQMVDGSGTVGGHYCGALKGRKRPVFVSESPSLTAFVRFYQFYGDRPEDDFRLRLRYRFLPRTSAVAR